MIPKINQVIQEDTAFRILQQPTKTYKLTNTRISGYTDEQEAMKQAIYKILNTERYAYVIYSWNYGFEWQDLIGKPSSYVYPVLQQRITEALTQDERITSVDAFSFSSHKKDVHISFTVHTKVGNIQAEKVVTL
ncbi:DUF2634 domain-containing protein [Longirhabdus pacifica]|uniref:DUF2634 domain-containing protein n=1 Tax=Longirhabdus pacifica TaxID=2305227 RepID=UPI0010086E63|nr:DUF2634 domain-containing protein [Longirhabdus pacifica]